MWEHNAVGENQTKCDRNMGAQVGTGRVLAEPVGSGFKKDIAPFGVFFGGSFQEICLPFHSSVNPEVDITCNSGCPDFRGM